MNNFLLVCFPLFFKIIQTEYLYNNAIGLSIISLFLIAGIIYFGNRRAKSKNRKKKFKEWIEPFITQNIIQPYDYKNENLATLSSHQFLLKNNYGRQVMINELLQARKNFSGSAGENIKRLYEVLKLDNDSEKKLNSFAWHRKAKGIQELSMMNQRQHWKKIYLSTNHRNEYVRMEAQAGIVRLLGFVGLRFLNTAVYPITEWQQVNLLQLISQFPPAEFKGQQRWLKSDNFSVVIFALKLAANFRRYELHDSVKLCLQHPSQQVRIQAVKTLGEIYQEDTHQYIINCYAQDNSLSFRLQALESLGKIGTKASTTFLLGLLDENEVQIKIASARALLKSSPDAIFFLQQQERKEKSHWHIILAQLKYEMNI